jgi:hypothetical protein
MFTWFVSGLGLFKGWLVLEKKMFTNSGTIEEGRTFISAASSKLDIEILIRQKNVLWCLWELQKRETQGIGMPYNGKILQDKMSQRFWNYHKVYYISEEMSSSGCVRCF